MKNLNNFWMPFTANKEFKQNPRIVTRAEGCYFWSQDNQKILDASSGLFCIALGHCRTEIADAVAEQMKTMDYTSPFQLAHNKGFELAEKLSEKLPDGIDNIFFTNSGSEAIDTAIKIATAYHRANGEGTRTRLISRERAYHGVNIGGTSLAGIVKNREAFSGITLDVSFLGHTWNSNELFIKGQPKTGAEKAEDLEKIVNLVGAKNISAVFIEPIAGSTGVLVPPQGYLQRLRAICDKYNILLVFDEVITGFCRTGKYFASETFGVKPDIITMAKALTNGSIPMGAVACSKEIYDKLIEKGNGAIEFFHGYTYSAHPTACVASLKTLELIDQENILENVNNLTNYFYDKMISLKEIKNVKDIRIFGLIAGIEFHPQGNIGQFGIEGTKKLFKAGLHVKFTGDASIIAPPLNCNKEHIDEIHNIILETFT